MVKTAQNEKKVGNIQGFLPTFKTKKFI